MKICGFCKRINHDINKFCVRCGRDIENEQIESYGDEEEHYCHRCDVTFSGGMYCPMCGREYLDGANLIVGKDAIDLKQAEIGSQVGFGSYYYDYLKGLEPISWIVLDKNDNGVLLVSKYLIDSQKYKSRKTDLCWEKSDIRKWLNGTFLRLAFTDEEKERIIPVKLDWFDSEDCVFLLNSVENFKYKKYTMELIPTPYAKERTELSKSDHNMMRDAMGTYSWLRDSDGQTASTANKVYGRCGLYPAKPGVGVRPAVWVKY
ncbi:MAG: hypothetical protein J6B45_02855 [Clostridia bacterium]|nr:hypothetical protein [Clostridia bacterium]